MDKICIWKNTKLSIRAWYLKNWSDIHILIIRQFIRTTKDVAVLAKNKKYLIIIKFLSALCEFVVNNSSMRHSSNLTVVVLRQLPGFFKNN